tara:strand:- start:2755 stop:4338 length:1584 start_codon:yes stop_codon:yes gene_type:complete
LADDTTTTFPEPEKNPYKLFVSQDSNQTRDPLRESASSRNIDGIGAQNFAAVQAYKGDKTPFNGPFKAQVIWSFPGVVPYPTPPPGYLAYDIDLPSVTQGDGEGATEGDTGTPPQDRPVNGNPADTTEQQSSSQGIPGRPGKTNLPWIVVRVDGLHDHIPNPAQYNPKGSKQQQFKYWSAIKAHFEVGCCLPEIDDVNYPIPNPGDIVSVTYTNARSFKGGRYKVGDAGMTNPSALADVFTQVFAALDIDVPRDVNLEQVITYALTGEQMPSIPAESPPWSRRSEDITTIVLHTTETGHSSTPSNAVNMWVRLGTKDQTWDSERQKYIEDQVSTHFIIMNDGTIIMLLDPDRFYAWHAGSINKFSVGIDFEGRANENGGISQAQVEAVIQLVTSSELSRYVVIGHRHVSSSRSDPGKPGYRGYDELWSRPEIRAQTLDVIGTSNEPDGRGENAIIPPGYERSRGTQLYNVDLINKQRSLTGGGTSMRSIIGFLDFSAVYEERVLAALGQLPEEVAEGDEVPAGGEGT